MDITSLTGVNRNFVSQLYSKFLEDNNSVDHSWKTLFLELGDDAESLIAELSGPSWSQNHQGTNGYDNNEYGLKNSESILAEKNSNNSIKNSTDNFLQQTEDSIHALQLIRAYRARGHQIAKIDPLDLQSTDLHPELDPKAYGFKKEDGNREIFLDGVLGLDRANLDHIMQVLKDTYCGSIGVEFSHIQDPNQKFWIQKRIESARNQTDFSDKGKATILERLTEAEGFEKFLATKYTGTKRFGLDGGEVSVPAIEQILKVGSKLGVEQVVLGMAHRGRLNILVNVMRKPFTAIFSEFQGNSSNPDDVEGSGDVKYHLGTSADREFDGKNVHLSLTANPSHLEVVDPVVLGKVRAKQEAMGDKNRKKVLGLLIHGDAAFAGQGIIAECFGFSQLEGYSTGGTIHFVINNQIGFTTTPQYSRSGLYCTDVAKMVEAPIFHVNGDDPEAVIHCSRIATEFRQEFGADVVIDLVCYRRHGHNEGDEPKFTQPLMYKKIGGHVTTRGIYAKKLEEEGLVSKSSSNKMMSDFLERMSKDFLSTDSYKPNKADWLEGAWKGLTSYKLSAEEEFQKHDTGVDIDQLKEVGLALSNIPDDFSINPKLKRQLDNKKKCIMSGANIDWSTAEALAWGSLLIEQVPVRLSGQDSRRGTFSQRHASLVDQKSETRFVPLNNIRKDQSGFEVIDSPLSELSIVGFEYGFSLAEPNALVMWEAQFGDFSNGAQMIIDQFISSGESKWLRLSGLTLLLPHGYEGQGPEHSSARIERYLQMCAQDNWQVCNLTTPANYFHALRRQVKRRARFPLIITTPKSLLRHKSCISNFSEMDPGSFFQRVIGEQKKLVSNSQVRRVILCTGKIYYDLVQVREKESIKDVAIVRLEQLYPWPKETLKKELVKYKNAEVVWCQEEPANMGAWTFLDRRLEYALEEIDVKSKRPFYAGRPSAASPATGLMKIHLKEQNELIMHALTSSLEEIPKPFARRSDSITK
ncbi:MAG: 2-oxoglutarate dehydrogenase E1 component [Pseudomonadota bacterium]|nr:2-oxoglutarate dehydrogenase E1 component [Pseudomonadota bacterium]